ncbi:hypothetical protein ALC57_10886 [Trachymyrmex cornetzi]|uniref:Uncharacterized protein n=1 Tax=Trachymyrmex cornetzi TaxID=471704 RepID=A0A151J396_9HYME|nr:hypothetical protein ALC57_10886 [Trachymyrmex cornetzi]
MESWDSGILESEDILWQTKKRTLKKEQEARVNKESKAKMTVYGGGIKPLYKKIAVRSD